MMVVTTTGYILETAGLYGANGANNDSSILNHMMSGNSELKDYVEPEDTFILDRGFRDSKVQLEENNVDHFMPHLLKPKQKQFITQEANESRMVTFTRWLVEAVNGNLKKKFHFFDSVIPNTYIPNQMLYFRFASALVDAYGKPLFKDSEQYKERVELALERLSLPNLLQQRIDSEKLSTARAVWLETTSDELEDFPRLSIQDLEMLTIGVYQIKNAKYYSKQHPKQDQRFIFHRHSRDPTFIKAKIQSKYTRSKQHKAYLQYDPTETGTNSITGKYEIIYT